MNIKDIRIGMLVTWGSGDIRSRVIGSPEKALNFDTGREEPFVPTVLLAPYTTPCGVTVPEGFPSAVPVSELRTLD